MLRSMRENASSLVIKALLGIIVIVFVFFGVGSIGSKKIGKVARVNGENITIEQYQEAYHNSIEQLRRRFGSNLNDEMIELFQVKRQALDHLIDQKVILQECERLNIKVTDEELTRFITNLKVFQSGDVFDQRVYTQMLLRNRMTPEMFEEMQRQSLMIEKLKGFIEEGVLISDQEAEEWYLWNNKMITLDYVEFVTEDYDDIKAATDEIRNFFETHGEQYKTQPMVKVRYLKFNPAVYESQVNLSEQDISDYYEAQSEEFFTPPTVEARHILIKLEQDADDTAVALAKVRAEEILAKARKGDDFAALARQYSEGPSKDKGGYLGAFRKESMVKPFADKAFSMKAGEISDPVRTRFGWHIIKVENVNEEKTQSLDEASPVIRQKLIAERARGLAYDDAESVFDTMDTGDDLQQVAEQRKSALVVTDFFDRKGPADPRLAIENPSQFASAAFELEDRESSDILEIGSSYYLIQKIETHSAQLPELAAVKSQVEQDLIAEKRDRAAAQDAEKFMAALKENQSLQETADKFNKSVLSTGFFKRQDTIPHFGSAREIVAASFSLSKENRWPQKILKGTKGYYVLEFKDMKQSDDEAFNDEKDKIKERLLLQKKNQTFTDWLSQLKEQGDIEINEKFLSSL